MATLLAPLVAGVTGLAVDSFGVTLISTGLALAATTAVQYFLAQGNETEQETGTKLTAQSGGAVPLSVIFGETETAGSFIYGGSWGKSGKTPNGYMVEVFAISDLIVQEQEATIWLNDTKYTIGATEGFDDLSNSIGYKVTGYEGDCWVKLINGATSVDPYLNAKFGSLATRPWEGIGRGRALMVVTCRYNESEPYGFPKVRTVIKGNKWYDWRLDSTNGGSGSHRYGTRSTYAYDGGNPVVGIYNIVRGVYDGSDVWMFGGRGWNPLRLDNDTFTAAANVCDEDVTLASGSTEKRFRIGAEVAVSEEPLSVIDRFKAACNGRIVESGGIVKFYSGGIGASVASFTDEEVIISEEQTGELLAGYQNTVNTISGTYVEPANGGQAKAYKSRTNADYVDADGEQLVGEFSSDCVRSNTQMQRLATAALKEARRVITWTLVLGPWARKLEPCDVVTWDSDKHGYTTKKFIVGDVTLLPGGLVGVVLREAEVGDTDWNVADEEPYTVGVYGDIVADTQPTTVTVVSTTFKDSDGNDTIPAMRGVWDVDADDVDCQWMRYQIQQRISGTWTDVDLQGRQDFSAGSLRVSEGLVMGATYRARFKIIPYSSRDTDWTSWTTFTAGTYSRRITTVDLDQTPPTKITDLAVSTRVVISEDGNAQAYAILTFTDPNTESCTYRVRINANGDQTYQYGDTSPIRVPIEAGTEYTFRVLPRSFAGIIPSESNPWSNSVTVTPSDSSVPTTAAGLTATGKPGYNALAWTPCPDKNYAYTEIFRRNEGASFNASDDYLVARVKGSAWNDTGLSYGDVKDYWIRHVNRKLTPGSQHPAGSGRTATVKRVVTDDLDQSVPDDVTGADVSARIDYTEDGFAVAKAIVSWDMQADAGLNYIIRMTGDGGNRILEFNQSPARIPIEAGRDYTFEVKAKRVSGVTSANWKPNTPLDLTPSGTAVPTDAAGLTLAARPGRVYLKWTLCPDADYAYTEIRRSTTDNFSGADIIAQIKGDAWIDDDPPLVSGNYVNAYYWIRHVNRRLAPGARYPSGGGLVAKARLNETRDIMINAVQARTAKAVKEKNFEYFDTIRDKVSSVIGTVRVANVNPSAVFWRIRLGLKAHIENGSDNLNGETTGSIELALVNPQGKTVKSWSVSATIGSNAGKRTTEKTFDDFTLDANVKRSPAGFPGVYNIVAIRRFTKSAQVGGSINLDVKYVNVTAVWWKR